MNTIKWILFGSLIIMVLLLSACHPELNITTQAELEQSFQETLDTVVAKNKNVHNAVVMVSGPDFVWKGAAGMAERGPEVHCGTGLYGAAVHVQGLYGAVHAGRGGRVLAGDELGAP